MVDKNIPIRRSTSSVDMPTRAVSAIDQMRVTDPAEARPVQEFSENIPFTGIPSNLFNPLTSALTGIADRRLTEQKQIAAKLQAKQEAEADAILKQQKANENLSYTMKYDMARANLKSEYDKGLEAASDPNQYTAQFIQRWNEQLNTEKGRLAQSGLDPLQQEQVWGKLLKDGADLTQHMSNQSLAEASKRSSALIIQTAQEAAALIVEAGTNKESSTVLESVTQYGKTENEIISNLMRFTGSRKAAEDVLNTYRGAALTRADVLYTQGKYQEAIDWVQENAAMFTAMGADPKRFVDIAEKSRDSVQTLADIAYVTQVNQSIYTGTPSIPGPPQSQKQLAAAQRAKDEQVRLTERQEKEQAQLIAEQEKAEKRATAEQVKAESLARSDLSGRATAFALKAGGSLPGKYIEEGRSLFIELAKHVDVYPDKYAETQKIANKLAEGLVIHMAGTSGRSKLLDLKRNITNGLVADPRYKELFKTNTEARNFLTGVYATTLHKIASNPATNEPYMSIFMREWNSALDNKLKTMQDNKPRSPFSLLTGR